MNTYANYFCQTLYIQLSQPDKNDMIINIISNLDILLKSMISFKAIVCLLETPIAEDIQASGLEVLKKLDKNKLLTHTRYFKVLESIITSLKEEYLDTIINIISSSIIEMLNLKQGYFLLRKIFKNTKQIWLQERIVTLITEKIFVEFMSSNNGCLLCQCIVRNFLVGKSKLLMKNSQSFNKQIIMKAYTTTPSNQKNMQEAEIVTDIKRFGPIIRFFDNFVLRIFPKYESFNFTKSVSKSHKKILEAFFEVDNKLFKVQFSKLLIKSESETKNSIVRQVLMLGNECPQYFLGLLLNERDNPKLYGKVIACLESLSFKGFPKELKNTWNSFFIIYKKNKVQSELSSSMNQLNLNRELSNGDFTQEKNTSFKNKLFVKINHYADISNDYDDKDPDNQFEEFISSNQEFFEVTNERKVKNEGNKDAVIRSNINRKQNTKKKKKKTQTPDITASKVESVSQGTQPNQKSQDCFQTNTYYHNNQVIVNQMQYMSYNFKMPTYSNSSSIIYYPIYNNGLLLNHSYAIPDPQSHSASLYIGKNQNGRLPSKFNYASTNYN